MTANVTPVTLAADNQPVWAPQLLNAQLVSTTGEPTAKAAEGVCDWTLSVVAPAPAAVAVNVCPPVPTVI